MPKVVVDVECGEKECGACRLLPQFFCAAYGRIYGKPGHPERDTACLAAEEQLRRLIEAARNTLNLLDGLSSIKAQPGSPYQKLEAALAPFEESQ